MLRGLKMVQSSGFAHGDIKPDDIGLSDGAATALANPDNVKLLDMGSSTTERVYFPVAAALNIPCCHTID